MKLNKWLMVFRYFYEAWIIWYAKLQWIYYRHWIAHLNSKFVEGVFLAHFCNTLGYTTYTPVKLDYSKSIEYSEFLQSRVTFCYTNSPKQKGTEVDLHITHLYLNCNNSKIQENIQLVVIWPVFKRQTVIIKNIIFVKVL